MTDVDGFVFKAPLVTTGKWQVARVPFNTFRADTILNNTASPLMDLSRMNTIGVRFEARNQKDAPSAAAAKPGAAAPMSVIDLDASASTNAFKLELEYIKAVPAGEETDFVLVSCGGAGMPLGTPDDERERVLSYKRNGERALKNSGLGYTVIRPGALIEEPGGSRALVFDQGGRITQGISVADVADICVKALHAAEARNKSFDVSYEYEGAGAGSESAYELVSHVPNKSNNYLTPALSILERNT